jgi:hypothetical protein
LNNLEMSMPEYLTALDKAVTASGGEGWWRELEKIIYCHGLLMTMARCQQAIFAVVKNFLKAWSRKPQAASAKPQATSAWQN